MMVGAVQTQPVREPIAREGSVALATGAYREQRTSSFTFVTADGDKVTLDASSVREVAFATYDKDGKVSTGVRASTSTSASLTVEGTLDAEELRDIRKALKFLRRAGRDGVIDEREIRALTRRHDLDSLQSIAGSVDVTRSAVALDVTA